MSDRHDDGRAVPTARRSGVRHAALVVVVGLVAGALTVVGQGVLPEWVSSVANSAGGWSMVAIAVALVAPSRRASVLGTPAVFVLLVLGYVLGAGLRGFPSSRTLVVFWSAAGIVVGPVLGLAVWWLRRELDSWRGALAVGVVTGPLVGDTVYGLTVVAETTSPVYWVIQLLLALALLGVVVRRLEQVGQRVLAVAVAAVVAAAFVFAYTTVAPGLFAAAG